MNNTMKLEQQVVSLELAKQLKESGVKQDSLFYWQMVVRARDGKALTELQYGKGAYESYSAFTVAELGEMFIDGCGTGGSVLTSDKKYQGMFRGQKFEDDNEANCRAKMLIWLIEEGYITQ